MQGSLECGIHAARADSVRHARVEGGSSAIPLKTLAPFYTRVVRWLQVKFHEQPFLLLTALCHHSKSGKHSTRVDGDSISLTG